MKRDVGIYLHDMLDACRAIEQHVAGRTLADYQQQRTIRSAVERELFVIGEALAAVRRLEPEMVEHITDAARIIGLRNQLAHAYFSVHDEEIWGIIENNLSVLARELEQLLRA
ncbi:MAG: HepT-like ribonuclease domain-containing protein [Phycisphaeraceae bacterium]